MAPLACTLALLAMTTATMAVDIKEVVLDMAPDSFDDQYQVCRPAMIATLPALNSSEFKRNPRFAKAWQNATVQWRKRGSRVSPLSSSAQAIALMAYTMDDIHKEFNEAVLKAGSSPQEYRDNFHFKTLHFLLTDALATLRGTQKQEIRCVYRGVNDKLFKAQTGDEVRFGHFASMSRCERVANDFGTVTTFRVETVAGVDIQDFSYYPSEEEVLIPPFETFKVTDVTQKGDRVRIKLSSTGTHSNYSCEWLTGGTIPRDTPALGVLLLATAALGVATGIF